MDRRSDVESIWPGLSDVMITNTFVYSRNAVSDVSSASNATMSDETIETTPLKDMPLKETMAAPKIEASETKHLPVSFCNIDQIVRKFQLQY